jgi:hypothetical protein
VVGPDADPAHSVCIGDQPLRAASERARPPAAERTTSGRPHQPSGSDPPADLQDPVPGGSVVPVSRQLGRPKPSNPRLSSGRLPALLFGLGISGSAALPLPLTVGLADVGLSGVGVSGVGVSGSGVPGRAAQVCDSARFVGSGREGVIRKFPPAQLEEPKSVRRARTETAPRDAPPQPPHLARPMLVKQFIAISGRIALGHDAFVAPESAVERAPRINIPRHMEWLINRPARVEYTPRINIPRHIEWLINRPARVERAPRINLPRRIERLINRPARVELTAGGTQGLHRTQRTSPPPRIPRPTQVPQATGRRAVAALLLRDLRERSPPPRAAPSVPVAVGRRETSPPGGPSILRHDRLLSEARERADCGRGRRAGVRKVLKLWITFWPVDSRGFVGGG